MIIAKVTPKAAYDVADFLNRMIMNKRVPSRTLKGWEEVRNALYAIADDTDAIVTDDELANLLRNMRTIKVTVLEDE